MGGRARDKKIASCQCGGEGSQHSEKPHGFSLGCQILLANSGTMICLPPESKAPHRTPRRTCHAEGRGGGGAHATPCVIRGESDGRARDEAVDRVSCERRDKQGEQNTPHPICRRTSHSSDCRYFQEIWAEGPVRFDLGEVFLNAGKLSLSAATRSARSGQLRSSDALQVMSLWSHNLKDVEEAHNLKSVFGLAGCRDTLT